MIKVSVHQNGMEAALDGKELEQEVDAELGAFSEFFCKALNNSSMTGAERAIIKTWLYWKFHESDLKAKHSLP